MPNLKVEVLGGLLEGLLEGLGGLVEPGDAGLEGLLEGLVQVGVLVQVEVLEGLLEGLVQVEVMRRLTRFRHSVIVHCSRPHHAPPRGARGAEGSASGDPNQQAENRFEPPRLEKERERERERER